MNAPIYWTCPGIGVVREEYSGCGAMYGGFNLYELLENDIPPITPVP